MRVLDYFEANNTAYLVMEYLEGLTFRQYMKKYGVFDGRAVTPVGPDDGKPEPYPSECVIHRDISGQYRFWRK
ncbi:MAG: hypothetical protein ACLUOI_39005 [Eisenbergiella sp.]